jgi:hypothetical protein
MRPRCSAAPVGLQRQRLALPADSAGPALPLESFASAFLAEAENAMSLGTILLIVLILLLIGALPSWGYSSNWGYGPSGGLGLVVLVVVVLLLMGRI